MSSTKNIYVFIDESGNFDFTPAGTRHFVLTAVSTQSPLQARGDLLYKVYESKYENWKYGRPDYYFHATEDRQEMRDWVFSRINNLHDIEVDTIVVQKNKHVSEFPAGTQEKFYDFVAKSLLAPVFKRHSLNDGVGCIVVVLGALFTDTKRNYVLKSLKSYLKDEFKKSFHIYFRQTSSDINCQIADYFGWAIYVKHEREELRPWNKISSKVKNCSHI